MQQKMKKIYLVDSENVGDLWVTHVMAMAEEQDEIIVFYTQKSPHMGYDTIRKLLASEREVVFVKCAEGKNALDFQLVTELGYRIGKQNEEQEYIMITNDTGFDAVVTYWQNAGKCVKRYNARFCQNQYNKMKVEEQLKENKLEKKEESCAEVDTEKVESIQEKIEEMPVQSENVKEDVLENEERKSEVDTKESEEIKEKSKDTNKKETETLEVQVSEKEESVFNEKELLQELVSCLGVNNSGEIHNALTMLLGNEGKQVYQQVKGNLKEFSDGQNMKVKDKFHILSIWCLNIVNQRKSTLRILQSLCMEQKRRERI